MKEINCLTRSLYHWDRYGGSIMYDGNHAKIHGGKMEYIDPFELADYIDAKSYGIDYFLSAHSDFLNEEEIEILNRYFESKK